MPNRVFLKEASDADRFDKLIDEMKDVPLKYTERLRSYLPFIKSGFMTPLNAMELAAPLLDEKEVATKDKAVKIPMGMANVPPKRHPPRCELDYYYLDRLKECKEF
jgi:hypothetical protein